ncbi:GntR family transcriptional regulator [Cupriavidus alkaliphilus]|uniref:GntR family transcriptional regulator n=1 Tax=Cupriavidus alkaliphilus TaxID=942866 RepID=UPI00161A546C|nr:GntR family transcriptional regulator [Cupriavidus alkaliphilus]
MSSLPTSLTGAATPGAQESGAATPGAGTQPLSPPAPAPSAAPQAAPPTGAASGPAPGLQSVPSPTFSPLYQQIKALITRSLQSGEWKPGEMIPSEMELASRYKVSQGTVRKAIDELAAENLVARRQGKGTFVTTHHEDVVKFRFLRLVPDEGEPHYGASHVLECKRLRAPAEIARLLDIRTGDSVVQIRRVLTFSGESTVLDEIWLLGANFKGLTAEKLTEWKGPMYALFEAEFGTRMIRASEKIRAVPADETAAGLLSVPVGSPLLSVERVSYTYGDRPVEVRRGLYVTTRHYYQNDLS